MKSSISPHSGLEQSPSTDMIDMRTHIGIFESSQLEGLYVGMHAKSLQSCPTLCDSAECSPPGSSVYEILQARKLEWVAMPSSRGSSWPRDQTSISYVSCIGRWILYHKGHLGSPCMKGTYCTPLSLSMLLLLISDWCSLVWGTWMWNVQCLNQPRCKDEPLYRTGWLGRSMGVRLPCWVWPTMRLLPLIASVNVLFQVWFISLSSRNYTADGITNYSFCS